MADIYFKVMRAALNEAIGIAYPAVDMRNKIPLLSSLLLQSDGEVLNIRATNLDVQIDAVCQLSSSGSPCNFTIQADRLKAFVAATAEGAEIAFRPGKLHGQVKIETSTSTVSLATLPFDSFPGLSADGVDLAPVNGAAFARALKTTLFAVSKREDRPYLTGICLHRKVIDEIDTLTVVATDALVAARIRCQDVLIPGLPMVEGMLHVIVPPTFAKECSKLFEKENDEWEVGASDTLIVAKTPRARVISKLIDGRYPDYERVIPTHDEFFEIDVAPFAAAIHRVAIVGDDTAKTPVRLRIQDGIASLTSYDSATGGAREALAIETEIEAFDIGFMSGQMLSVLQQIDAKYIRVFLGDAGQRAFRIEPVGSSDTFVVMPVVVAAMPEDF